MDGKEWTYEVGLYFPIAGFALSVIGCFLAFHGMCTCNKYYQLTAGILLVNAGLFSLTGLIVFIDNAADEISNKKTVIEQTFADDKFFTYSTGTSVVLLGVAAMLTEFAAGVLVSTFVSHYKQHYVRTLERFRDDGEKSDTSTVSPRRPLDCTGLANDCCCTGIEDDGDVFECNPQVRHAIVPLAPSKKLKWWTSTSV